MPCGCGHCARLVHAARNDAIQDVGSLTHLQRDRALHVALRCAHAAQARGDDRSGSSVCASGQVTAATRFTIAHPLQPRPASSAGPAPAAAPPQRALPALSQPPARAGASKHDRKEAQQQSESARRRCRCGRHGSGVSMASMSRKYVKTSDTYGPMQCKLRRSGGPKHKARLAVSCPPCCLTDGRAARQGRGAPAQRARRRPPGARRRSPGAPRPPCARGRARGRRACRSPARRRGPPACARPHPSRACWPGGQCASSLYRHSRQSSRGLAG